MYIWICMHHRIWSHCLMTLRWRHNGHDGVSNQHPHHCLLNRLFGCRSKKTSKPRVTGLCVGNSPVNSPHKWPVTRKMFPFDDVIMTCGLFKARVLLKMILTHSHLDPHEHVLINLELKAIHLSSNPSMCWRPGSVKWAAHFMMQN